MRKLAVMLISFGAFSGCAGAVMASGYAECSYAGLEFKSDSFTKIDLAVAAEARVQCGIGFPVHGQPGTATASAVGDLLAGFARSLAEPPGHIGISDQEGNRLYDAPGLTFATAYLYIEHSYVLLGGHGQATLDQIGLFSSYFNYEANTPSCHLSFGLDVVDCQASNLGWVVTFGVPFTLVLDISTDAIATGGNSTVGGIDYDLSSVVATQNGVAIPGAHLVPIPEPSPKSLFLLGLAVVGLLRLTQRMSPSGHSSVR